jgi:hypothetical protein
MKTQLYLAPKHESNIQFSQQPMQLLQAPRRLQNLRP